MNFEFEIQNKTLKQKESYHHHNEDFNDLFCSFTFITKEWKHLEKYVIFWNKENKSTIYSLGTGQKGQCPIPKMILNDSFFYIQIYANDNIVTQKLKIYHSKKKSKHSFKDTENKIDNIVYYDNKLLFYANNKLKKTIDIVDNSLIDKIIGDKIPVVSEVATTGSYNDLIDIPSEYPPIEHTHYTSDIIDFEEAIEDNIENYIMAITAALNE